MANQLFLAKRLSYVQYDEYSTIVVGASSIEEARTMIKEKVTDGTPDDKLCDFEKYYDDYEITPLDTNTVGIIAAEFKGG